MYTCKVVVPYSLLSLVVGGLGWYFVLGYVGYIGYVVDLDLEHYCLTMFPDQQTRQINVSSSNADVMSRV